MSFLVISLFRRDFSMIEVPFLNEAVLQVGNFSGVASLVNFLVSAALPSRGYPDRDLVKIKSYGYFFG